MSYSLKNKHIVLVVTGGIAAYKSAQLVRELEREGAMVRVAMTKAAAKFVTELTFQTLSKNPVATDLWAERSEIGHISLADWAQAVVIAPATGNIIGKMAGGIADDFVSTFLLAVKAPILVCPSMNVNMFDHPAVQGNIRHLQDWGYRVLEPDQGYLACGWEGRGRLPDLPIIVEELKKLLAQGDLIGLRVLVTAGPTREPWDDIRYLSNRSTGRMGLALAQAAWRRGAEVTLITGPINLPVPYGVRQVTVETTNDMLDAVHRELPGTNVLVKAAAPADFRPATRVQGKVKKGRIPPPIELAPNPDILKSIGEEGRNCFLVGFAAESENLLENAKAKLAAKNLDLIVANQIGPADQSFGAETNRVWIIDRQNSVEEIPLATKEDIADHIWDRIVTRLYLKPSPYKAANEA
ncbi:MAG: bifunctional phosphopantothenoylcysteine decarboxylase/phosphopantothenate--cysteine ligase CoaBC [Deltaproteobacteria bacterium]|nr:bifunctional phosphopantothenoylcysteine decarboxylase/phosphopantothenate--cysteine ligase CoaBC [Deltaproteobacteria bacterium]